MKLIIDNREQSVIKVLDPTIFTIEYELQQLYIGDYHFYHNDKVVAIIERKTLADYSASFKDGRSMNLEKLLAAKNESGCKLYYIIEGPLRPQNETKYAGISYMNIRNSLARLSLLHDIHIIRTRNIGDTIDELMHMSQIFQSAIDNAEVTFGGAVEDLTKLRATDEQKMKSSVIKGWATINGVSHMLAIMLHKQFTFADPIPADLTLQYPSGVSVSSKTIAKLVTRDYDPSTILACCPGISLSTAKYLLTQKTYDELLSMPVEELKTLKKTEKIKVNKLAEKLYTFLHSSDHSSSSS